MDRRDRRSARGDRVHERRRSPAEPPARPRRSRPERLRADNAQLASKLSERPGGRADQALARTQLGVQPALAQETTYVRLKPKS
jgi:hypothetical protein